MNIAEILEAAPLNGNIQKTLITAYNKLYLERNPVCSVSGGSDSDILIDIIERVKSTEMQVKYVFFDTGLEYQATHRHLNDLEVKYNIKIERYKACLPIPISCKKYGQPFISKTISDYVSRLQKHEFDFSGQPFEELYRKYPKCKAALKWWCNAKGKKSKFNISVHKYLKEFMIENPPKFPIHWYCCEGAKKAPARAYDKKENPSLKLNGIRRAEGGARSTIYKNCFSSSTDTKIAEYRMLFFWSDEDKRLYKEYYGIQYSDCYEVYGLKRTGCAGCPFSSRFEEELEIIQKYESKLYKMTQSIFGDSYAYMREYREYKKQMALRPR